MSLPPCEPAVELPQVCKKSSHPPTPHKERHSDRGDIIRDIIIGYADGLTVPFALTAGLSSLGSSKLVIIGGLAELFSGAISMGLGAYLAAVTEREHYFAEEKREWAEVAEKPDTGRRGCREMLEAYGVSKETSTMVVDDLCNDVAEWVRFIMAFELRLEKPKLSRAWISAATMGLAYFIGGLIPMIPYFAMKNVTHALYVSIAITVVILLVFGYIKNWVTVKTKRSAVYGALQTLFIGVLAAGASYGIVKALDSTTGGNGYHTKRSLQDWR